MDARAASSASADAALGTRVAGGPARPPGAVRLQGRFGSVVPLDPARHAGDLCAAMADRDELWLYTPYGPFADAAGLTGWLHEIVGRADRFVYAVAGADGRALGVAALMNMQPAHRVIEIGQIILGPALQRTPLATEAQYVLARYAFETLGYRRYEWKCNALNAPSRRAAERFGFTFEGVFRQHMIVKGRNRDTAWFAMLDSEWPARKRAFERWLAADNFDAQGRQKQSLREAMRMLGFTAGRAPER